MPVNSWTMARKLEVSVVSTVVGARREALERFFELLGAAAAAAAPMGCSSCGCIDDDDNRLVATGWVPSEAAAAVAAVMQLEELGMRWRGQGAVVEEPMGRSGAEESR